MDPVTVGLLAAVAVFITLLSYALFRYFNAESDFEKAYGANALKLLSEDKTGKPKSAKTSKTKSKGSDKKKETSGASSDREAERKHESGHKQSDESVAMVGEPVGEGSSKGGEVTSEVKHKKKKQKLSDEAKPTEGVEVEKENKAPTPERFVEHLPQEKMTQTDASFEEAVHAEGSEKKSSRKKKYRRADESTKEQLGGAKQKLGGETTPPSDTNGKDFSTTEQQILDSEVEKEAERIHKKDTTVPLTTEPAVQQKTHPLIKAAAKASAPPAAFVNKEEKPKVRTASISLKDITIDKLHSRLSSIAELESEYVSFLTRFFSDNTAQKMKLSKEVGTLREQIAEKGRLAEQISNALTEEKKKVVASEKSAYNIRAAFAQEKKSFVRAQDQLKAENSSLKDKLQKLKAQSVKVAPPPVDITPFQKQIDGLRSELNANKVLFTKTETELAQKGQALLKAEQDFQACGRQLEQVKKENAALQKRILDADAAAKAEHGMMEAELNNASKGMMELEQLVSKLQNEMANRASAVDSEAKTLQSEFKGLSDLRAMLLGENRRLKDKLATTESEARESLEASGRERKRLADERKAADARCDEALAKLEVKQARVLELEKEKKDTVASFNMEKAANEKKIAHQKAMMHILELRAQKIGKEMDKVIAEKEEEIQCAAGQLHGETQSECGTEFRPSGETTLSPLKRSVSVGAVFVASPSSPSSLHQSKVAITPNLRNRMMQPEMRAVTPSAKTFKPSSYSKKPNSDADHENEDAEWREALVRPRTLVTFELHWPVKDWSARDAPKEVAVSGSFWGWQPPRAMHLTKTGYALQVELPLVNDDERHKKRAISNLLCGPCSLNVSADTSGSGMNSTQFVGEAHEFKFFVDGVWRCADHYAKKRSDDGRFENNVVYY